MAEYKGHLVGFILARTTYAGVQMTGVGVVLFLTIHPDYQNCGIGSKLIYVLKNNCKTKGIETIRVLVHQNNTELMKYFEKMDFCPSSLINLDCSVYPDYQL